MNKMLKAVAATSLLVVASFAMAQQGQGGGGQGQGQGRGGGGQGRGGFGQGMMGGGASPTQMVFRPDVQTDLKISTEQKEKLNAAQQKMRSEMQAMMENMQGGGGQVDRTAFTKVQETMEKDIKEVLTDEQEKRLKEIFVQTQGNRAILNADVQKDLGLTDDQKAKLKTLQDNQMAANNALRERMRNQEIDRQQMMELQEKNSKTMNDELAKILTAEQTAKLKEMGGAPFKADPPRRGGGGGGGF